MARKKKEKKRKPEIELELLEEVELTDPVTGKKVKHLVKIQKLKSVTHGEKASSKDYDIVDRLNQIDRDSFSYE